MTSVDISIRSCPADGCPQLLAASTWSHEWQCGTTSVGFPIKTLNEVGLSRVPSDNLNSNACLLALLISYAKLCVSIPSIHVRL
jgi:hypothetical protein